jgi:branched-chain amino acid transport system ATP-binding protein
VIRTLKQRGFTILLVEQNFRFAAPSPTALRRRARRVIDMIENSELAQKTDRLHEYLGV